ncbi:MAG: hypothetical protein KME16_23160 [Scytolyngbya sp. HA4215-MV1]|nr:hypothetical protein [Scytolyngbya sp. HA4215-MV1]
MAHWVKISYERNAYILDLERVAAFCCSPNGKITFSLPDGNTTLILTPSANPEAYQTVRNYIEHSLGQSLK